MEIKLKGKVLYTVTAEDGAYGITAEIAQKDDMDVIHVTFDSASEIKPPIIEMNWSIPCIDVQGTWHPVAHVNRGIPCVWGGWNNSSASFSSPMYCLYSNGQKNRMTYACSDGMNCIKYKFVLREEDSNWLCSTRLFDSIMAPLSHYECDFRIDYRDIRYEDAITDVVRWWAAMPQYEPMAPVDECTHPLYSTWYSFHQMAYGDEIEQVLSDAAPLGFKAVIVDDGWQMEDYARTYAYCGDWEPHPKKIADMKAHVQRVHDMGLKYYLWYSVPFVGIYSRAYERFKGKYLSEGGDTSILDPRYPDVREYLISTYENAVKDWDLDGFKLDFVDNFRQREEENPNAVEGKDYVSVAEAVDRLMTDIKLRLQAIKPSIAIEFRQSYVGPLMRKYGNMFRAADCANETVVNKIRTIDTKLCMDNSIVHSDMITWHKDDTPEAIAQQFIGTMFAVPQISVRPGSLPEAHRKVMKAWILMWEEFRDTILTGKFRANNPELLYTSASVESDKYYVCGAYANGTILPPPEGEPLKILIANGIGEQGVAIKFNSGKGHYTSYIRDCFGEMIEIGGAYKGQVNYIDIPVGGTAVLVLQG